MNSFIRRFKSFFILSLMLLSFSLVSAQESRIVITPTSNSNSFVHSSATANNSGNVSYLDSPLTNGNPNAIVFYTHNWNPDGNPAGTYTAPYPLGVWYDGAQWTLFNQDGLSFVADTYFNIMVQGLGGNVFLHTSTADNIISNATLIDNPLTNNNPDALLFVAPNWTASEVYHDHSIGVYYDSALAKWMIFNEDVSSMQADVAFNVIVKEADGTTFVHTKVAGDGGGSENYSALNNPYLNNNPYAEILVTQQFGYYNDSEVGVWYDDPTGTWYIYNENASDIPAGTQFNVHIASNYWDNPNVLVNGGFEVPGETASQPINWSVQEKAKRKCSNLATAKDVSAAGECAMSLKAVDGLNTQIKQAGVISNPQTTAWFLGHFSAKNVFGGLKATAKLTLSNGTDYKVSLDSVQLNSGTYDLELDESTTLPATAVAYNVKIKLAAPTGKVLVDEMALFPSLVLRSTEAASLDVLPLPGISTTTAAAGGPSHGSVAFAQPVIAGTPGQ